MRGAALPLVLLMTLGASSGTDGRRFVAAQARVESLGSPAWTAGLPIVADHDYSLSGRIRPLLLFWIGRDRVGLGRLVWRKSPGGELAFELLVGSDPQRAPRRLNRWGYLAERVDDTGVMVLGAMSESKEQSFEEAKRRVEAPSDEHTFVAIRSRVTGAESVSELLTLRVQEDLTYRDVPRLIALVDAAASARQVRRVRLTEPVRSGFLSAVAHLIHRSLETRRSGGGADRLSVAGPVRYVYNGALYDLRLLRAEPLGELRVGSRRYAQVVRGEFEIRNVNTTNRTPFEIVYGTSGQLAEVPIRIRYQPRWWLEVELTLDDS